MPECVGGVDEDLGACMSRIALVHGELVQSCYERTVNL